MYVIGITGGAGAGKTEILKYIREQCSCKILLADDIGNLLKEKGQECYEPLVALLGKEVLDQDGSISHTKMAAKIFSDGELLKQVNALIHPAVRRYLLHAMETEREKGEADFFFVEAALLIECGYQAMVDEMWYIYADESVRRKRLKENRGYEDARIDGIFKKQLSEQQFKEACDRVIDNSGAMEDTEKQIDQILGDPLWKMH